MSGKTKVARVRPLRLSQKDKVQALMSEFGYTRKEAVLFLRDMGE